ncbi:MAG: O-antigen ligase family protein [Lachnospiraceae bacterium]|nr:O-antigen ligase family protein [Lachnospiraceae bacterium]
MMTKRRMVGTASVILAMVIQTLLLWNEYEWYEIFAPLATLISFVFLATAFFCFVKIREAVTDPFFYLMAAGSLIAGINLIVIGSNKGAWLTATDVLLVIYLAGRIRLPRPVTWFSCAYTGFYFYYWTYDVKGFFKGYNTNYGGLVLITGFVFAVTGLFIFREKLKGVEEKGKVFLSGFIVFMFAWGYNIIAWYRARCALLGLVVFALLLIMPSKVWNNRVFYTFITIAMTVGSVIMSVVYVILGFLSDFIQIRIFYKDIISGRNEIWADLWRAFLQKPLTGIGSSYIINVDWMDGVFEVHNGLLDILIVHGIIVFAITCFMLIRVLLGLRGRAASGMVGRSAVSAVFAILAASFMENFFIVPPFLICTLVLIAIAESEC